jgi:UDP-hydrolysing UDP-N-acetyl-D-glucosamine 2-epimerase
VSRRICVFTGTRADYGLLRTLVRAIHESSEAELQLVVSGTHLSGIHGTTAAEVRADGFPIAAEIPVWSGDDSPRQAGVDVGAAVSRYTEELDRLGPDLVVVLGDRLEALAMALAATVLSIPVAHIHGGEVTEGAMDDSLRHAITKLSYLHFVSTTDHARRVMQLGEAPERVFSLGAPAVDALGSLHLLPRSEVEERFGVRLDPPTALVTFHPAGLDVAQPVALLSEMLDALSAVEGLHVIITGTNNDIGSVEVRAAIADFVSANPDSVDYVESFGSLGYLSAMAAATVVVGNSSSVVLEAPLLGIPSVLVGDRQKGRPLSSTVLVSEPTAAGIGGAIQAAIAPEFTAGGSVSPFGEPGFASRALAVMLGAELARPPRKAFVDVTQGEPHD